MRCSEAPNWTIVFCTLSTEQLQLHPVLHLAVKRGLEYALFEWVKPNLYGKSMAGGDRHHMCSEHIVVVYKREANSAKTGFGEHFALRKRKAVLEANRMVSIFVFLLFYVAWLILTHGWWSDM